MTRSCSSTVRANVALSPSRRPYTAYPSAVASPPLRVSVTRALSWAEQRSASTRQRENEGAMMAPSREKVSNAYQILARHGIEVAHDGVDEHTLARVAASYGWSSSVERISQRPGTDEYHALVWAPVTPGPRIQATIASRQRGTTAAEALALALARMFARQERFASPPAAPLRSDPAT